MPVENLVAAVGKIDYGLAPAETSPEGEIAGAEAALQAMWLRRVLVAWPLGVAVLVLSMVFMHEPWARWSALALTVPVQVWAGWPFFHQAAFRARAGRPTWTPSSPSAPWPPSPSPPTRLSSAARTPTTTSTPRR